MPDRKFSDDVVEEILDQLADGQSLNVICGNDPRMPTRRTVERWQAADEDFAQRVYEAREAGYLVRAERAVEAAKNCADPIKGRLAFDAERWYLGKLSIAFRDKPPAFGAFVSVGSDDAFAAFAGALEEARSAAASRAERTFAVEDHRPTGPADAAGGVADLAGAGGEGLGQDPDGC